MQVGDTDLYGMEIDVAAAAEEIRNIGKADKGKSVDDVLGSFGLGAFAEQLKDLRLSMLLSVCMWRVKSSDEVVNKQHCMHELRQHCVIYCGGCAVTEYRIYTRVVTSHG